MSPENIKDNRSTERWWRELDPIETSAPGYDDSMLAEAALEDIAWVDNVLETDQILTAEERAKLYAFGCDLRLEWLYAEHGGAGAELGDFNQRMSEASAFFGKALKDAEGGYATHPQRLWGVTTKYHDLLGLQVYRNAREAETTLKGTPAESQAWALAENQMSALLQRSIKFTRSLQKYAYDRNEFGSDASGGLYENLLMTYQRLHAFERQEIDQTYTRSALSREDRPWNGYAYPKRAFDIVIQGPDGKRLIQAKNYQNEDEYAPPIEKVTATRFRHTVEYMDMFMGDLQLLISNPSDPNVKTSMDRAAQRLDDVFGAVMVAK